MSSIHVFVSFDVEHDGDLYELLLAQSRTPGSVFAVLGGSERLPSEAGSEKMRRRIREADQVIVICGAHTGEATRVSAELLVAQEERTPYFMLWGRRETMCTKPSAAKASEGMYSWTRQTLEDQMILTSRKATADAEIEARLDAARRRRASPS